MFVSKNMNIYLHDLKPLSFTFTFHVSFNTQMWYFVISYLVIVLIRIVRFALLYCLFAHYLKREIILHKSVLHKALKDCIIAHYCYLSKSQWLPLNVEC